MKIFKSFSEARTFVYANGYAPCGIVYEAHRELSGTIVLARVDFPRYQHIPSMSQGFVKQVA